MRYLLWLRSLIAPDVRPPMWQVQARGQFVIVAPIEVPESDGELVLLEVFESHLVEVEGLEGVDVASYLAACFE